MENFISMEQYQCPVCLELHSHGAGILLTTKFQRSKYTDELKPHKPLDRYTFAGRKLCETHQQQADDDYVFLVAAEARKITPADGDGDDADGPPTVQIEDVTYVGKYAAIKRRTAEQIMTCPVEPLMFCDEATIEWLSNEVGADAPDT